MAEEHPPADHVVILLSSAGRRNYLVQWFRDALGRVGVDGSVIVADADPHAPARAAADVACSLPPIAHPGYAAALRNLCKEHGVSVAVSLNDFELSTWAGLRHGGFMAEGCPLICLPEARQRDAEDKIALASAFEEAGIRTPRTVTGADILHGSTDPAEVGSRLVIKNRFGSGSSGLSFTTPDQVSKGIEHALATARDPRGHRPPDSRSAAEMVVVQEFIAGAEYGIDCVNDFEGDFAGVLARRKIRMRSGETDQAESVDGEPFDAVARSIAGVLQHQGLVDCDLIQDEHGTQWLIDVNPRFGGGYPFSHLAGADIPSVYVARAAGRTPEPAWLSARPGVVSSKYIGITTVRGEDPPPSAGGAG